MGLISWLKETFKNGDGEYDDIETLEEELKVAIRDVKYWSQKHLELENQTERIKKEHNDILSCIITENETGYVNIRGNIIPVSVGSIDFDIIGSPGDGAIFRGAATGEIVFDPSVLLSGSSQ